MESFPSAWPGDSISCSSAEYVLNPTVDAPQTIVESDNKKKQQPQQPRQLLSCTKCRERKVKVSFLHNQPDLKQV